MNRPGNAVMTLALAATLPFALSCGGDQRDATGDSSATVNEPSRRYLLETVTVCGTGDITGIDRAQTTVELTPTAMTIGFDDEVLAGIPLPVSVDQGSFELNDLSIPTDEEFGELLLRRACGTQEGDSLRLEYEFLVLDVSCATTAWGSMIE